nr:hypothetical protein [Tanacetum cinerariifolium]
FDEDPSKGSECRDQEQDDNVNNTNNVNATSTNKVNVIRENISSELSFDPDMPALEDISTFNLSSDHQDDDKEADINNMGIDYDEVFSPVARIEAIRLFLAYAFLKYFVVYQMNIKSGVLYGKIEEEVYVCQPPGFEDPNFPDKVYIVKKALYGLHQAPRAWYETLSTYLLYNGFHKGKIDKTLFIRRHKGNILLVQVYVDDIIFGSTRTELCIAFEKMMREKFQMKVKNTGTPIKSQKPLLKDEYGKKVDVHMYRLMIGSLMYLTSLRPDIMFAVCAYARYQVNPKVSYLHDVKRIFKYLKGPPKFGLWYPKDSPFDLVAYTNSGYAGASLDRKSTIGGCQFLRKSVRLIMKECCVKNKQNDLVRKRIERVDEQLEGMPAHNRIYVAPSHTKKIFRNMRRVGKGYSRRETPLFPTMMVQAQKEMGEGLSNATNPHHTPTIIEPSTSQLQKKQKPRKTKRKDNELPQTSGPITNIADEAINKEMDESLERAATTASSIEAKVKKLKTKQRSRTYKLKRLYKVGLTARVESSDDNEDSGKDASKQGRISAIDVDEGITLVISTSATTPTISIDDVTLAQALADLKHTKPKAKAIRIVFHKSEESTTTITIPKSKLQDKGKAILIEEPVKLKKKDQIMLDEEVALKLQAELQAEFDKEQRLTREKAQKERSNNA